MSMFAYDLTGLTGRKKNQDRTVIVATVEVNRFTFAVAIVALTASILPAVLIGMVLGPLWPIAIVVPFIGLAAGLIMVDQRSKGGLRLRRYQNVVESRRRKAKEQTIYVCSVPLVTPRLGLIVPQFIDTPPESQAPAVGASGITRQQRGNVFA